jgi:hypothetical protein
MGTLAALSAASFLPPRVRADEYAGPGEVLDAIERREADVDARLRAIAAALASAQPFASAVLSDHDRFRQARADLRRRLRLSPSATPPAPVAPDRSLEALREAQLALVHAHAEGLSALGQAEAVDILAHHMVEGARHLTVIDLWIELENARA